MHSPVVSQNSFLHPGPTVILLCLICDLIQTAVKHLPEWVPGIKGFKSFSRQCKVLTDEMQNEPFEDVKMEMVLSFFFLPFDYH